MKLIQISDIHFGKEHPGAVKAAADYISKSDADVLVVCGDLTQRGKRVEFDAAAQWLGRFELPIICVPGNHDVPLLNIADRAIRPFSRYDQFLDAYSRPLNVKGYELVGYNTARGWQARKNWAEGSVDLDDLDELMDDNGDADIFICHHPFLPLPHAPLKTRTKRGQAGVERLSRSKAKLALVGHVHAPSWTVRKTEHGQYVEISCGTLSERLRDVPPSFNVVELREGEISLTVLVYEDGAFSISEAKSHPAVTADLKQT